MTRAADMEGRMEIDYTRQRDWFDPSDPKWADLKVTIGGCGGIGSPVAVFLSKFGIPKLTLVDPDVIEAHNIPNQFFPTKMVGKPKVAVTKAMAEMFGVSEVTAIEKKIQEVPEVLNGIVIGAFDNMEARYDTWNLVKGNPKVRMMIDGRLAGMKMQIFTVDPNIETSAQWYEDFGLFPQDQAEAAPCTAQSIIQVMLFIAGFIVDQVYKTLHNQIPKGMDVTSFNVTSKNLWLPLEEE